jgi:predicted amidohydrolase YtcJ
MSAPALILHRGLFTTLDRGNPTASAVAIQDGVFTAVGHGAARGWRARRRFCASRT